MGLHHPRAAHPPHALLTVWACGEGSQVASAHPLGVGAELCACGGVCGGTVRVGWFAPSALFLVGCPEFMLLPVPLPSCIVPASYRAFDDRRAYDDGAALGASPAHAASAVHIGVVGRLASLTLPPRLVVARDPAGPCR